MSNKYSIPELIDNAPLTPFQWRVFILCFLIAIFDGFDTQAVAFTGPALIQAFNLGPGALGPVMAAGTAGMVVGAMILGLLGDKTGRRPAVIGAVALFGGATLATAFATSTEQMIVLRFIAGLGMGGATPIILSLAAEYGPSRMRGTIMTTVLLGLPAGAILGGLLAAKMLPVIGWQGIYIVGGIVPLALLVILIFALPESLQHLASNKIKNNTAKIYPILRKIVKTPIEDNAEFTVPGQAMKTHLSSLFANGLARNTTAVWAIYMFNWIAWFMLLSWLPTVLKAAGLPADQAPLGTVTINAVFVLCAIPLSMLLPKVNTRLLLLVMFTFGILLSFGLANSGTNWTWVFILAGAAGMGIGGQQIVLNYMVAQAYPTTLRATATGWAIAVGRIGAIIGSASGGWVLEQAGVSGFFMTLALPLAIATAALLIIKPQAKTDEPKLAVA